MPKFEIKATLKLRVEGIIEAENVEAAYDAAKERVADAATDRELTITETLDVDVWAADEVG